jgi:amino acid permease
MKFLKGIVAGVVSIVVGAVVIAFGAIVYLRFVPSPKGRVPIATHLATLANSPVAWVVAFALFLFGFAGEYRRN